MLNHVDGLVRISSLHASSESKGFVLALFLCLSWLVCSTLCSWLIIRILHPYVSDLIHIKEGLAGSNWRYWRALAFLRPKGDHSCGCLIVRLPSYLSSLTDHDVKRSCLGERRGLTNLLCLIPTRTSFITTHPDLLFGVTMIAVWLMWEGRRCRPCGHTRLVLERRGRNFSLLRHRLFRSSLWSTYHSIESTDSLLLGWAFIIFRRVFYQIGELFVAFGALFFRHGSRLVVQLGDLHRS